MGLELSQLYNLRATPLAAISIGYLPNEVALHIKCPLAIAYLSSHSLNHILDAHPDVTMLDMLCLPEMVRHGLWIADGKKTAAVIYVHPETGVQYKGAIKSAGGGYESYICTFHRLKRRQRDSLLRRGPVLVRGVAGGSQ